MLNDFLVHDGGLLLFVVQGEATGSDAVGTSTKIHTVCGAILEFEANFSDARCLCESVIFILTRANDNSYESTESLRDLTRQTDSERS